MSNYTKSTNFTAKDSLPTGDTNKVIRGSEFDTEFDAIQTAVGTKSDLAGPTFTGTATFDNITATGTVNFTGGSVTTNIDGGTIDGVTIGGTTAGAGTFTTVAGTTGTFSGAVTGSNLNVSNWDTAYGWGDHGVEGYLTSVSFPDIDAGAVTLSTETFVDSDTQIPTNAAVIDYVAATIPLITEVNDLTASVTWANVPDANITESSVTQHQAALAIAASQLSDVTSTAAELNILDGVTSTAAELNILDGVTSTAAELNILDGVTATTAELNYTDGVTSNIQTQLDSKVGANYTGDVNITGELLVDSYNETFKQPSQGTGTSTFDWSVFAASGNTKSASGTDRKSIIQWKPDGTRFFLNDHGGSDAIYQFDLSTANDFSTASLTSTTTSASAGFSNQNMVIVFSSDGQYLFGVEVGSNAPLYRLTLNTAWQPSAGSSAQTSVRTLTSGGYSHCVDISDDGTKFYVLDDNDTINEYTFGTAYDPSTLGTSPTSTFVPTGGSANIFQTFKFTNSGSNLIALRDNGATLYEYALSTAYDLSTINSTPTQTISASTANNSSAMGVHPENTHIYVASNSSTNIVEYTVTSTINTVDLDCEAANVFSATLSANTEISFSNPPAAGTATDSTAYAMSLKVVQDSGASGYTVTWPASVDWPSATAPTLTATASAVDQFVFYTYDGGTTWYGFTAGQALG